MPVERFRERRLVLLRAAREDRLCREPRGHERLVDPVARERIDEAGRVPDEENAATGRGSARLPHGKPVAANGLERRRVRAVLPHEAVEPGSEARPLAHPAPDAEVGVVPLREHPAVPAGHDAELDPRGCLVPAASEGVPGDVPLERDAAHDAVSEPGGASDDAVRAVGADEEVRSHRVVADLRRDTVLAELERSGGDAVAEGRPGEHGLLREVHVETPPLRHQDERLGAPLGNLRSVCDPYDHAADDVLDDGLDVARRVPERSAREPSPAGLVAGKAGPVREEHARAGARQMDRGRRARRPGAGDEDVEPLHASIVGVAQSRRPSLRAGRRGCTRSGDVLQVPDAEASFVRTVTFLALAAGVALIAASIGLGMRDRGAKQRSANQELSSKAADQAAKLEEYFERARSIMLITAQNPAFRTFYSEPGSRRAKIEARTPAVRESEGALVYLEKLYPKSIGEACFIDRTGPENARYVRGTRAAIADLSPDESGSPFFAPTFALKPGEVFQAKPYVSPDTGEWVISNSTPVPGTGYPAAAIVHFEITVESFRRTAAAVAKEDDIAVVDAASGSVILDSRFAQKRGRPLGRPSDMRFARLVARGALGGTDTRRSGDPRGRKRADPSPARC
jgi:hypothetical protein